MRLLSLQTNVTHFFPTLPFGLFFFRITQYIGDTHNARALISMNTRMQTLPLGAYLKTVTSNFQD
jgi:hypothetical protein